MQLRSKVLTLPKLYTAQAQRAAGGNLQLAVLDETENYEGRIAFKCMTFAFPQNTFSKGTVADRNKHWVTAGTVQFYWQEKNTVNSPSPSPYPVCQRSAVWEPLSTQRETGWDSP
jgi:hypothetical protein